MRAESQKTKEEGSEEKKKSGMPKGGHHRNYAPSLRQRMAINKRIQNPSLPVSQVMLEAGFSKSSAHNATLNKSRAFKDILEQAGLSDEKLALAHQDLMSSSRIDHKVFQATERVEGKGKKKRRIYTHLPDEVIKKLIEKVRGHKVIYINKSISEKTVYFEVPESIVRKGSLEMAYKIKGHFAAERVEIGAHYLSDEEKELIQNVFGANTKK